MSAVRSMTGYALARDGEITASLRSVNHRGLDIHFHVAPEYAVFENAIRGALKRAIVRGHVEVRFWTERNTAAPGPQINHPVLLQYVAGFREAAKELQLVSTPDLNAFLALPGVVAQGDAVSAKPEEDRVTALLETCIADLNGCREREGAALSAHVLEELAAVQTNTREIQRIRAGALAEFHQRLRDRLKEVLNGSLPESRLAEEAALLADRSDVQEELTRLSVHSTELRRIVEEGGEVGKRLDFLLQEMNRETNTVLSKTSGLGETGLAITKLGLSLKAHIEKIREQALNLE